MKIKALLTVLMFLLITSLFLPPAFAQSVSLGLSPPLLELVIKPGKSILIAYRIDNNNDPVVLSATVKSFEPKDSFGHITIKDGLEGPVRFSLDNADLQLNQPFLMKTKSSTQLLLRIRVPDGAPEGDYYYSLLADSEANSLSDSSTQAGARATIGSNILITVSNEGKIDVNGKIVGFDVIPRFMATIFGNKIRLVDSSDKIPVVLTVRNDGMNRLKPEGEINLVGNFGEKATYDILPQNVLANSSRVLSASSSASLDNEQNATLLLEGFFVGKYTLNTSVRFGEGTPAVAATTSFLALPLKLGFGIGITIVVLLFLIKRFHKQEE